jgi:hypothetical protein
MIMDKMKLIEKKMIFLFIKNQASQNMSLGTLGKIYLTRPLPEFVEKLRESNEITERLKNILLLFFDESTLLGRSTLILRSIYSSKIKEAYDNVVINFSGKRVKIIDNDFIAPDLIMREVREFRYFMNILDSQCEQIYGMVNRMIDVESIPRKDMSNVDRLAKYILMTKNFTFNRLIDDSWRYIRFLPRFDLSNTFFVKFDLTKFSEFQAPLNLVENKPVDVSASGLFKPDVFNILFNSFRFLPFSRLCLIVSRIKRDLDRKLAKPKEQIASLPNNEEHIARIRVKVQEFE